MAKTQYSIRMDYANAKREVERLEELAKKIDRQRKDIINCRNGLAVQWKSDSATAYLQKMMKRAEELQGIVEILKQIAETTGTVAANTYQADKRALELAKQRTGGGGACGGGGR